VKRFWKDVTVTRDAEGWGIRLDGRPLKTPARSTLTLPHKALAEAIAEEWRTVGEKLEPRAMPLTGLANAAVDRVAPDKAAFPADLARYAEADLACYRAEAPQALVQRQELAWDALLGWARRRFDVDFATTTGLIHVPQPRATVDRLSHQVALLNAFQLAAMSPLVTIGGSLLAALAVVEKALPADQAWEAVSIDERWQLEQWGSDAEAELAMENRKRDFLAAARFLRLVEEDLAAQQERT
jgi:chaperone required for assembly of F1-ATPase